LTLNYHRTVVYQRDVVGLGCLACLVPLLGRRTLRLAVCVVIVSVVFNLLSVQRWRRFGGTVGVS
jgi:hypothetical protein